MSARKVRLVADLIRGMSVPEASVQLRFLGKRAADPLRKLLHSAVKNGEHRGLNPQSFFVAKILVGDGPILKRWLSRARGAASPLYKRTSNIFLELQPMGPSYRPKRLSGIKIKEDQTKGRKFEELEGGAKEISSSLPEEKEGGVAKEERRERKVQREETRKGERRGFLPKLFRRKSV